MWRLRKAAEDAEYRKLVREEDGIDLLTSGDLDVKQEAIDTNLEVLESLGRLQGQAKSHLALGIIAQKREQKDRARTHFERSRGLYRELDMPYMVRRLTERIGELDGKRAGAGSVSEPSSTQPAPSP